MARKRNPSNLNRLSVKQVQAAGLGDHSDGGGLILRIRESRPSTGSGGSDSANWVFRFTAASGRRREMGLGTVERNNAARTGGSLTTAREKAGQARALLSQGNDPIDERAGKRQAAREAEQARKANATREQATLARVARAYHLRVIEPSRTPKHSMQWITSLENHVPADLWHKPIAEIEAPELLDVIITLQAKIPETAARIRQRLESIFDDAVFRKLCTGNPAAAIRRKLREAHAGRDAVALAALPFAQVPAFVRSLRDCQGIAARCLEFALLTAARTGEAISATWEEIDLEARLWTIPAARMKGGEKHAVHLSRRALEILAGQNYLDPVFIFPSPTHSGKPLSNMALLTLLRRMNLQRETTVHGLCRSSFSTWANEKGIARPDVIEACLAHREADKIRSAYNRATFAEERKALLNAWADYLDGKGEAGTVLASEPVEEPMDRAAA